MKTTIAKTQELKRKWYLIDAKDKVLGHLAPIIADKLRGKGKPIFSPHMDCGDFVIVINAEKVKLSGDKIDKKMYYTHSGYMGSLKEEKARDLLKRKPTRVLELAVRGMLPRNKLRNIFMKKLKLYAGETHKNTAQSPELLEV
ncbi:MAG: 50S ribosomal protein L13 [Candidatus Gracilibacteria bacterium]|jgi:large subunit ribosomal protein L13